MLFVTKSDENEMVVIYLWEQSCNFKTKLHIMKIQVSLQEIAVTLRQNEFKHFN